MKLITLLTKSKQKLTCLLLAFLIFSTTPLHALESDQYAIWKGRPLPDSIAIVNKTINKLLKNYLSKRNLMRVSRRTASAKSKATVLSNSEYPALTCQKMAKSFFYSVRPNFFKDGLKDELLSKAPQNSYPSSKKDWANFQTIYSGAVWPFVRVYSRTVNINGVYLGTDKIDHFFSSGQRYFNKYRSAIKEGLSVEEAKKRAIDFGTGVKEEKGWLGLWSSGAFSYADLEANYQGMQLLIDMCEGDNPILSLNEKQEWTMNRSIDMAHYVNPLWDEAYNNSYFTSYRARQVKRAIKKNYCEEGLKAPVKKLWANYRRRTVLKPHTQYVWELIQKEKIPNPKPFSIEAICGYKPNTLEGNPLW